MTELNKQWMRRSAKLLSLALALPLIGCAPATDETKAAGNEIKALRVDADGLYYITEDGRGVAEGGLQGSLALIAPPDGSPDIALGSYATFRVKAAPAESMPLQLQAESVRPSTDRPAPLSADEGIEARFHRLLGARVHSVDVRTEAEYVEGHVPHARNISSDQLALFEQAIPDKEDIVFLYCRSGRRSAQAAAELIAMGYRFVFDLGGVGYYSKELLRGDAVQPWAD